MSTFTAEEADAVERILLEAPGATHNDGPLYPLPKPAPTRSLDVRLTLADRAIKRCRWRGHHTTKLDHLCTHCRENGYPVIH